MNVVRIWMLLVLAGLQAPSELEEKMVAEYCDGVRATGDLEELRALGEPGRLALLDLAEAGGVDAGCAYEHLANLDDRRVLPYLREALSDGSELPPVRRQAVAFLGLFEDRASLGAILELFETGDHGMVMSCLSALGSIDDPRARRALREAASDPGFERVLPTVVRSIGRQRDAEALEVLDALAADTEALSEPVVGNQLRYELALAFARIGTAGAHERAVAAVGAMENPEKKRLTIRDVGREIRRQMDETREPERRDAMDAHLRALAEMYRELDAMEG